MVYIFGAGFAASWCRGYDRLQCAETGLSTLNDTSKVQYWLWFAPSRRRSRRVHVRVTRRWLSVISQLPVSRRRKAEMGGWCRSSSGLQPYMDVHICMYSESLTHTCVTPYTYTIRVWNYKPGNDTHTVHTLTWRTNPPALPDWLPHFTALPGPSSYIMES